MKLGKIRFPDFRLGTKYRDSVKISKLRNLTPANFNILEVDFFRYCLTLCDILAFSRRSGKMCDFSRKGQ